MDPHIVFSSDASGSWGCGAVWQREWLQCPWDGVWLETTMEVLPIVLAVALWGKRWEHMHVLVECDNMAVVQVINNLKCRDPTMLHLAYISGI